jgi:hypothetical protein
MSAPKRISKIAAAANPQDSNAKPESAVSSLQSANDECESFLARKEPWVRSFLTGEEWDIQVTFAALNEPGGVEAFLKTTREYDELLKRCPKHLREHRRRFVDKATQSERSRLLWEFGKDKAGRTPRQELQDLGRRAAKLYNQGHSWGEVARRLCLRKGLPGHKCNKGCADRISQNAKPYLGSLKRKRGNSR